MSDLVERLRETYESVVTGNDVLRNPDGPEAAARIQQLEAALRWAVPLAALALEESRMRRVKAGHTDIKGTYKSGTTWAGIHQSEVDALEEARAALENRT